MIQSGELGESTVKSSSLNNPIDGLTVAVLLIIFPFIRPSFEALVTLFGYSLGDLFNSIFVIWNYISVGLTFIWFISTFRRKSHNVPVPLLLTLVFLAILLFSTYQNSGLGGVSSSFLGASKILSIFLLAEICKTRFGSFLRSVYLYLTFSMILNSASMFICYPHGLFVSGSYHDNTNYYLYSLDNLSFIYSVVGFYCGWFYSSAVKGKVTISFIFSYLFIFGSYLYVHAGTAMAVIGLSLAACLAGKQLLEIMTYKKALIVGGLLAVFVISFQTLGIFDWVLGLIGKDLTFSGRTYIWNSTIQAVNSGHQLFGYGLSSHAFNLSAFTASDYISTVGHAHSIILEYFYRGGYLGVFALIALWVYPLFTFKRDMHSYSFGLLSVGAVLVFATVLFEYQLDSYPVWFFVALLNYAHLILPCPDSLKVDLDSADSGEHLSEIGA